MCLERPRTDCSCPDSAESPRSFLISNQARGSPMNSALRVRLAVQRRMREIARRETSMGRKKWWFPQRSSEAFFPPFLQRINPTSIPSPPEQKRLLYHPEKSLEIKRGSEDRSVALDPVRRAPYATGTGRGRRHKPPTLRHAKTRRRLPRSRRE